MHNGYHVTNQEEAVDILVLVGKVSCSKRGRKRAIKTLQSLRISLEKLGERQDQGKECEDWRFLRQVYTEGVKLRVFKVSHGCT